MGLVGAGRCLRLDARSHTQRARVAIVTEMHELNRPVAAKELYARLDRAWSLEAIERHLVTLVKSRIIEVVYRSELHFSLTGTGTKGITRERCR